MNGFIAEMFLKLNFLKLFNNNTFYCTEDGFVSLPETNLA